MPPFVKKSGGWLNGRENGVAARWNAAAVNDLETRIETAIGTGVGSGGGGPSFVSPGTVASNQTLSMSTYQEVLWVVTLGGNLKLEITGWSAGKGVLLVVKQDTTGGRVLQSPPSSLWEGGAIPVPTTTPNAVDVYSFTYDGAVVLGFDGGREFA